MSLFFFLSNATLYIYGKRVKSHLPSIFKYYAHNDDMAHVIHKVVKEIRLNFQDVNKFILFCVKKIIFKSLHRL